MSQSQWDAVWISEGLLSFGALYFNQNSDPNPLGQLASQLVGFKCYVCTWTHIPQLPGMFQVPFNAALPRAVLWALLYQNIFFQIENPSNAKSSCNEAGENLI